MVFAKRLVKQFLIPELISLSVLVGLSIFVFTEFLLLQFLDFGWPLILIALLLSVVFMVLINRITFLVYKKDIKEVVANTVFLNGDTKKITLRLFIFGTIWYLAAAVQLFNNPPIWWDEIIHWIPKAKVLIESGSFKDLDLIPFEEYPRFWSILLADFMILQDKLTQIIPIILYYVYWVFAITASFRFIKIRNLISYIPLSLVVAGAFINIGWGAPYSDLPLSVFYSLALILMLLIVDQQIQWKNVGFIGILLGMVSQIRTEGVLYSLAAILVFCLVTFFINKINALKSFALLIFILLIYYLPWQIYLHIHSISNDNFNVAVSGFNENWNNLSYMLQKSVQILAFFWQEIGKIATGYFVLTIFTLISILSFIKIRDFVTIFSTLIILVNFLIVFIIILFSPTLTGGYGGLSWWLSADFTRFTNHYLPFVFFSSAILLYKLQSNRQKS